jgi:hypothetical protein
MMKTRPMLVLLTAILLLLQSRTAHARTFTTLEYPEAEYITKTSIDGDNIVGSYETYPPATRIYRAMSNLNLLERN